MSPAVVIGIALMLLVSIVVRIAPTQVPAARRLDLTEGSLACLPHLVLINLIAVCLVAELQVAPWPAAAGFAVGALVMWRRPACNLLLLTGLAVATYYAVHRCLVGPA